MKVFTYGNEFTNNRSSLDNFSISESLSSEICRDYIIHQDDNPSDYIPIAVDITISID